MVTSINRAGRGIAVGDGRLPFSLALIVGSGLNVEIITIDRLVRRPEDLSACVYEVTEFYDLKLSFSADGPETAIAVKWGDLHEYGETEEEETVYFLSAEEPERILYQHADGGEDYPWRCGLYHFEVEYAGRTYYGGFRVVPKNVDDAQLKRIHELIHRELEGLATDYLNYKKTFGRLSELKETSVWRFLNWYGEVEDLLLTALRRIEETDRLHLEKVYEVENEPRRLDAKCVRWRHSFKGQLYASSRHMNRRYRTNADREENRFVKHVVYQLLLEFDQAIQMLKRMSDDQKAMMEEAIADIRALEAQRARMASAKPVTERDKRRISDTIRQKEAQHRAVKAEWDQLKNWLEIIEKHRSKLAAQIHSQFWQNVQNVRPRRIAFAPNPAHRVFYDLWKTSRALKDPAGQVVMELPVYKPTPVLYEYFVYFGAIHALTRLGFEPYEESVADQLMKTFYRDGLKDGTRVWLIKDDRKVCLAYNEMIEPNAQLAIEKGTHFYSVRGRRKPDIRIDCHAREGGAWRFRSSFILEVKYSPFYNIYQSYGRTKAMEQMADYWAMMYVDVEGGEKKYQHDAVKNVVCVYPGDPMQPLTVNSDFGPFLQFYPNADSEDIYDIIGIESLEAMISEWLG